MAAATSVIAIEGDSFVNFAGGSSAIVLIDHISLAEIQTVIGEGKFGIAGVRNAELANYAFSIQGSGVALQLTPSLIATPQLTMTGFIAGGDFQILATGLNSAKSYKLTCGTNLGSFPDQIGVTISGESGHAFVDDVPPAGKAFNRLEEVTP